MKVIVTGGLGHIGSALIRDQALIDSCDEIVIIDDLSTQRYCSLFHLPTDVTYRFFQGDVAERLTPSLLKDVDAVVHLAGNTEPLASALNPDWHYNNNLRITKHVVDTCAVNATPLVFVSTTSVYTSTKPFVDENCDETTPSSPYARCKLDEEAYVHQVLGSTQSIIYRLGTIFGVSPGMRFHTAVNKFCWQAANGEPIEVWSTAMDQLRPYLALSDATATIAKTVVERIYPGEIVNAVTCDATVREVLEIISAFGCATDVRLVDSEVMNSLSFQTSTKRATDLGLEFRGNLQNDVFETLSLLSGLSGLNR